MDARPPITPELVLSENLLWPIETVLENGFSVHAFVRRDAFVLLRLCRGRDINRYCLNLGAVTMMSKEKGTRLAAAIRLLDDLTGLNWMTLFKLSLHTQTALRKMLLWSVKNETDNRVSTYVGSLIAGIATITRLNGWCSTWPEKVMDFLCKNLVGNSSDLIRKRVLQIFSEWFRLGNVLLVSAAPEMKNTFQDTILGYLREWNPIVSIFALEAAVCYLPHLRRTGEDDDVFGAMLVGIISFLDRAWLDGRQESLQEALEMLIVLARRRPELLMDNELYKYLMGLLEKEKAQSETVSTVIDFLLVLAENAESSVSGGMGIRLDQLIALFFHQLTVIEDDGSEEESETYYIGWEGIVRVAGLCGGDRLLGVATTYHRERWSAPSWVDRRAVVALFDAIIEGCSMEFNRLKVVLSAALMFVKDQHPKVKTAALKLVMNLFLKSRELYDAQSKVQVQRINELLSETDTLLDQEELQELAAELQHMYK